MEDPVHAVFVIGRGENVGDEQFPPSSHNDRVVSEVGVLEEDAGVFFVDADGILNGLACTGTVDKVRIHIVDRPLTIAPKSKAIGHVTTSVLAQIKSVFPVMRMLRVAVWYHHLRQRKSVEDASLVAFVIVGDVVQHDALAVIETDVNLPVLPFNDSSIDLEGNSFRLSDIDRLQILAITTFCFNCSDVVIIRRCLVDRSSHWRDIDVDNLLSIAVEYRSEVQGIGVLAVVDMRPVVHQSLLKPDFVPKTFIKTNSPRITIDLVHVLLWYPNDAALLDDFGVDSHDMLHNLQIFHCNQRLHTLGALPLENFRFIQIDQAIIDCASLLDRHDIGNSVRSGGVVWIGEPR